MWMSLKRYRARKRRTRGIGGQNDQARNCGQLEYDELARVREREGEKRERERGGGERKKEKEGKGKAREKCESTR